MIDQRSRQIFRLGSRTYYLSSLFLPEPYQSDVFALYAFVRSADDYVDRLVPDRDGFYGLVADTWRCVVDDNGQALNPVVGNFAALVKRVGIERTWVEAFLASMELDLYKSTYHTIDETVHYMYGSAEVIGLMMARIFQIDPAGYGHARMLGRAMQYINMIRDVQEDVTLGRWYLPVHEYVRWGLPATTRLTEVVARQHPEAFVRFMRAQLTRQMQWMLLARAGFAYLPRRARIPVATASQMYDWTAGQIWQDPFCVWQKKVKPSAARIVASAVGQFAGAAP